MQGATPSFHPKYRTKLCRNFVTGGCPFGQKCSFLHPTRINPASSLLARQLFNLNPLLPQLFALSNQQATLKTMARRSPPRSQGPQLVDEDPSLTTSLLLSKSDCTSSERMPGTKSSNKRKKYPCRHFVRTGGWCPAAGQCKFQHDLAALPAAGVRRPERAPPLAPDALGEGARTISGGVLMCKQSPSPPIVNQVNSAPPRYTDAELIRSYQPMFWPNYTWQPYHPYFTSLSTTAATHIPTPAARSSVVPHCTYPLPHYEAQTASPGVPPTSLPMGSYEVNGTTYFPTCLPRVSAPPPVPYSFPVHPLAYNPPMAPVYPYYAPPRLPAGYYDANVTRNVGLQSSTSFDPFASDRMMLNDLPVIPRLEDYEMSPVQQDVLPPSLSSASLAVARGELASKSTNDKPCPEHEFPYQPPKDQRVGHARRISVDVKKRGRVNSS